MAKRKTLAGFEGNTREIEVDVPDDEPRIWGAGENLRIVGTDVPRIDGHAKATGGAEYTADTHTDGMLHAAMFRAPVAGGTVVKVDVALAAKSPGVRLAKVVAREGTRITHEGQDLAILVADTPDQVADALAACTVDLEPGPVMVTEEQAMADGAPSIYPDKDGNVRRRQRRGRRGSDGEEELAAAEEAMAGGVILERTYRTQVQTHSSLETHGVVVRPDDDDGVTVWASTQGTFSVRGGMARALKLPQNKVRVITEYMGGGFGCKFGPSAQGSGFAVETARAALELGKPIRHMLNRREEHLVGGNRPSSVQTVKMGLKKDGKVLGYTVRSYGTAGKSEGGAGVSNPMIYRLGVTAKDEATVVTHTAPAAAFRAPGHPQGSFALESMMDEAAEAIGMDPLEFRKRIDGNETRQAQYAMGAQRFDWKKKRKVKPGAGKGVVKTGVGMGSCIWYQGGGPGSAVHVTVHRDGSVEVSNGAQDIGTGTRTLLAMITAEVLGLEVADIKVNLGQTQWPAGPGSGGSTTAPTLGPCARAAAEKAKAALGLSDRADARAFRKACAKMEGESRTFEGTRPRTYGQFHRQVAGCQFAEVAVDTETGVVKVERMLAIQDCGRTVNRLLAESQVIGGVINGISYALFEERHLDPTTGRQLNADLEGYRVAGSRDIPDIEAVLFDVANAGNNVGMMGLGEPPKVPTAGAIANAVYHATGARVRELPITPARVLAALEREGR